MGTCERAPRLGRHGNGVEPTVGGSVGQSGHDLTRSDGRPDRRPQIGSRQRGDFGETFLPFYT